MQLTTFLTQQALPLYLLRTISPITTMYKSHQVSFYMSRNDLEDFESALLTYSDVAIIEVPLHHDELHVSKSFSPTNENKWLTTYITLSAFLPHVLTKYVPLQKYWLINEVESPVVEFSRCYENDEFIRVGRLYFISTYDGDEGKVVSKPEEFIRFANWLIRWIRKAYTRDEIANAYIGNSAMNLYQNKKVRFLTT